MIEVKQVIDVHGRSLLVVGYALTYRRDGDKNAGSVFERLKGGPEGMERREARNKVSGDG